MTLAEAQREMRAVYLGGSIGQFVSGGIWLISAILGTWVGERYGILALFLGGMFIFPLTQSVLRGMGKPANLSRDNPLGRAFLQSTIAMGITFPLVFVALLYRINWFYPAFMLAIAAHYLSFIWLYGMWQYGLLAGVLVAGGISLAMFLPGAFSPGGWLTGVILIAFSTYIWSTSAWKSDQHAVH